ncbi:MAG: helix-turn-helix transcriptional regulator [Coriobacteriales bacterium]|nr:helix-turn-helix transcriptional regulator [Coriobacteriales bacterium]
MDKRLNNEQARELLGMRVTKIRKDRHLSQGKLSAMAGLDRTYILDIEKGRRNVSVAALARIAWSFGISLAYLLEALDDVDSLPESPSDLNP